MEHHIVSRCPVCDSSESTRFLKTKDWFLSQEDFELAKCSQCGLVYTHNVPVNLADYYKSDEYISHSEKGGLITSIYKIIQGVTLSSKRKLISSLTSGTRIIDYGSGKADFLSHMKARGYEVHGFEPDPDARNVAYTKHNIKLLDSPKSLPNQADIITMWHVLEHVPNPVEVIKTLGSKLSKSGVLLIAVPNFESYDSSYYKDYWAAYDVPRHLLHFSTESMKRLIESSGLRITEIKPMWFDSTYVSILSEKYQSRNRRHSSALNMPRALFIGLFGNILTIFKKKSCSSLIYIVRKL